jgi:hypothetical protein
VGPGLLAHHPQGGPGRSGSVQDVINAGFLTGRTEILGKEDRELYAREHEYNSQISSIRAPIERAVAHLKSWKVLFTDYRRPLNTFLDTFRAAIGLYFFELSFQ